MKHKDLGTRSKITTNSLLQYFPKSANEGSSSEIYMKNEKKIKLDTSNDVKLDYSLLPGYSVKNFDKILTEIFANKNDSALFSNEEIDIVNSYKRLSIPSKKLFLKLYGRQWKWQRFDNEKNNEMKNCLTDLLQSNFISNEISDLNLTEKLDLLLIDEVDKLMKKFNLKSVNKRKNEMINAIVKASNNKNEICNFFVTKSNNSLLEKVELELKKCFKFTFKLNSVVRKTFCKITVLSSITTSRWDDYSHLGEQNQRDLFLLLQIDRGEVSLPVFKLSRVSNIFTDVKSLDDYVMALEYSLKLRHFIDNNKIDEAHEVYLEMKATFPEKMLANQELDSQLTSFLRCFTLRSLLVHAYSLGVSLLEKRRDYRAAVDTLEMLLETTKSSHVSKSRGKWYLRLCVNYKSHLKSDAQSTRVLEEALRDNSVPEYFRLTFANRLEKSRQADKLGGNVEDSSDGFSAISDRDIHISVTRVIEAPRQYDVEDSRRPRYIWRSGETTVHCHVEDYVIHHSIGVEGYTNGLHGETGTFILYFVLLFYDVIYADVPDVFYSWRQTVPLDMYYTSFRHTRATLIENHCDWLVNQASQADIDRLISSNWTSHCNELGIANWGLVDDEDKLLGLFHCLGVRLLLQICDKFLSNFSYWSSGMPDLVVWDLASGRYEIIEVKGPGDKLSDKQKCWIVELQKMGANVSVCQVTGGSGGYSCVVNNQCDLQPDVTRNCKRIQWVEQSLAIVQM